ncbi:MAG: ABC transporter permease [Candidatus Saccharimonadales bacterium]
MMLSEHLRMARSSIKAARFRSFLTMLGIIIGVVSVITTVSLGEGVKRQVSGQTNIVGNDLITIRPGSLVKRDAAGNIDGINILSFLSASKVTNKDLQSVQKNPDISVAVPLSIISGTPSIGEEHLNQAFIMATDQNLPKVINQSVEFGNFFGETDKDRKVAVIGIGIAEKLFKENVPLGKTFQLRGQDFIVRGVFERFPTNPLSPEADFNNAVFIPYESATALVKDDLTIYEILARPKDPGQIDQTIAGLTASLKENHAGQDDFTVLRQDEMAAVANSVLGLVTTSVTIMAAVSLFVGGVGIMNVMLVSVTERTREIGIRKAVGATNRQIQSQFLVEAMVISIWGAAIGIGLSGVINVLLRILTNLEPTITWPVVVVSAGVSVAVGIVFGLIPAVKASRKDPIEALRSY